MTRIDRMVPWTVLAILILGGCATGGVKPPTGAEPPATLAPDLGHRLVAAHAMVSSANPLASEAGVEILREGGNAVDAAVATAFAIGVVEPQMSGLGAGGAMVIWRTNGGAAFEDFYSAEPVNAFRGHIDDAYGPGRLGITAVPGDVAGLLAAQARYGKLTRAQVMAPAIRLAQRGYPINQILAQMIAMDSAKLSRFPASFAAVWPDGKPLGPGVWFRNPELAATLRTIAQQGAKGFYDGDIARKIVAELNAHGNPTTLSDFASYAPRWRRPLCGVWHGRVILSAPPPESGMEVIHTLKLLEPFDLKQLGLPTRSARAFDVMASAMRVGIADNHVNNDPAWAAVPAAGVVSTAFARQRDALVGTGTADDSIMPGNAAPFDHEPPPEACRPYDPYGPATEPTAASSGSPLPKSSERAATEPHGRKAAPLSIDPTTDVAARLRRVRTSVDVGGERGETTHISVVDAAGDAVALTQTNSELFGAGARVLGFFLNDSGFRFRSKDFAVPDASAWRIRRTTISPTIVLEHGRVKMVVGAPGGGRIPTAMVQVMSYVLDYGMDPYAAVRMPRIFPSPRNRSVQLENGFSPAVLHEVRAMGYEPAVLSFGYARLYMIVREDGYWVGSADPRHDGGVRGY